MINFDNLSRRQKRALIASDVIDSIESGYFVATTGGYISYNDDTCEVCAYGACFVAMMTETKLKHKPSEGWMILNREKLGEVFSPLQMFLIEQAFEGPRLKLDATLSYKDLGFFSFFAGKVLRIVSHQFYREYPNSKQRLLAIMGNIVDNGFFNPFNINVPSKYFKGEKTEQEIKDEHFLEVVATLPRNGKIIPPKRLIRDEDDGGIQIEEKMVII